MTIEQARAKRWTPETRAKQAAKIQDWQPWTKSTGAKTPEGKAVSSMNACKGYKRKKKRDFNRVISGRLTDAQLTNIMVKYGIV